MAANEFGVTVDKNPTQSKLTELGVATWPNVGKPLKYFLPNLQICKTMGHKEALNMIGSRDECWKLGEKKLNVTFETNHRAKLFDLIRSMDISNEVNVSWWSCGPSKFPWSFSATETMYLLEGKVNVEVDGKEGSFTIGAGDFVVFPKGMKVTWDVIEAVNKHYSLEE
ncbi:hypothetical protein C1H46_023239 [Malus baccata]|uniref:(S)-ureidoglycine aminohydrolase cupin domain-containing protein n=1 Tax=Malus baccata TaxID=106549 RepID=A0A540LXJ2_MALBA|nr:hypothetical protein C1H46_023239 [Malus baccata]